MKYEFGVAWVNHMASASADCLTEERFKTYDEADDWAYKNVRDGGPTIYLIVNDKYAFYPAPFAKGVESSLGHPLVGVQFFKGKRNISSTVTTIYWEYFSNHVEKYYHLAQKIKK